MYAIIVKSRITKFKYLYPIIYDSEQDALDAIFGKSKTIKQIPQARSKNNILKITKLI